MMVHTCNSGAGKAKITGKAKVTDGCKFKDTTGYKERPCFKQNNKNWRGRDPENTI